MHRALGQRRSDLERVNAQIQQASEFSVVVNLCQMQPQAEDSGLFGQSFCGSSWP